MNLKQTTKKILGIKLSHRIATKLRFCKDPELKKLIAKNSEFKNIHKNKRCFIFGNGPSLKNLDFSIFGNEYTITVNQLPKNHNFYKLKTNYHVWADENFFKLDDSKPEDMEIIQTMKAVNCKDNKPVVFYKDTARNMVRKYSLDEELDIKYYAQGCWEIWDTKNYFEFDEPVPGFGTVVHYCICLAVYMGFSEIYLLGCDCTGIVNAIEGWLNLENSGKQKLQYAYEVSENEKKVSQRGHMNCSMKDEFMGWAKLFDDYERLRDYCANKNVRLYNATTPSLLQSINKIDLKELFGR